MKTLTAVTVILLLAASFIHIGHDRAEAITYSPAVIVTGSVVISGDPVVKTVVRDIAYPTHFRHAYPPCRYIEKTKIIYVDPKHRRRHMHRDRAHWKERHDEWCRHDHQRERDDAKHDHRHRHHDNKRWD